jgi:hypothetical protein
MTKTGSAFESFHEGITAGHDAGRSQDLLYAFGFLVGFVWGALENAKPAVPRTVGRATA